MKFTIHLILLLNAGILPGQEIVFDSKPMSNNYPDSIHKPYPVRKNLKSSPGILDSVYYFSYNTLQTNWEENQSTVYSYDEQSLLTLKITRTWNSVGQSWINQISEERFYDDIGLLTQKLIYSWSQQSGTWISNSKIGYTFNSSFLLDHYQVFSWNEVNQDWDNVSKYSYGFDLLGNWTHYLRQYWNADSSGFINDYQFVFEFDGNVKTNFLRQNWDHVNNAWINDNRSLYHYDLSGLFIEELQEVWDKNILDWKPFTLIIYTYNEADLVIEKKYQSWNGTEWLNFVLYDYSYNEKQQNTMIRYSLWNGSLSSWDIHNRYIYEFDEFDHLVWEEGHSWNSNSSLWEYLDRFEYYYSLSPYPLYVIISDSSNISCYGYTDGWAIATASGGVPPYSYSWDDDAMTSEREVSSLEAGRYYRVKVTDSDLNTATDSVILSAPPMLDPGPIYGDTLVEYRSHHDYYVQAHPGSDYYWTITGGKILSGQGTSRIKVAWKIYGTGSLSLIETDSSNCQSDPVLLNVQIGPVSIPGQLNSDEVLIYPNPFRDELFIEIIPSHSSSFKLEILNSTGILYKKLHFNSSNTRLSLLDLPSGIFILKLWSEEFYHIRKIVKDH